MLNIGINILGQVARTALFSAVSTKVVDSIITSKINKKNDHNKWMRETKLNLFSKISNEILSFDIKNSSSQDEKRLKEICNKTVLLLEDKKLIIEIQEYLKQLSQTQRALVFDENNESITNSFNKKSMNLVISLNNNLKRS